MIKTTLKEIKRNASIHGREEFKKFLSDNDLKPVKVDIIAYSVSDYGYLMELEGLEGDELVETVEDYLNYNTILLGTFEDDGITYFIFDEF